MAKIIVGDFGNVTPGAAPIADVGAPFRAAEQVGAQVQHLGMQEGQQRQEAAQAQAANAYLDHQIGVKTAAETLKDKLARGEVQPDDAPKAYADEVAKLPQPQIDYLDPASQENLQRGLKRNVFDGEQSIARAADVTRRVQFKDQFTQGLDKLGKLAGMPGADINSINAQAESFRVVGQRAGVPIAEIDQSIQNFKDQTWLNDATQRAMESADDLQGLAQVQHDLTAEDGYYAGKLDTNKRNAVLRGVLERQDVLKNRLEHVADRREARAEHAMNDIQRQIASGVPATTDMWANWATVTGGTTFAGEFHQAMNDERQVQTVLRQPIDEQLKFVQDKEAQLVNGGGDLRELANLQRLKGAVQQNVKLLQEAPLLYNANRTGEEPTPLDVTALGDPNRQGEIGHVMQTRAIALNAMRRQYGSQVPLRPLLPQEAASLVSALNMATPKQQTDVFAALRNSVGNDEIYKAAMLQIAPDAPVKAIAGILASRERTMDLTPQWYRSKNLATSGSIASTMLYGESLMDPSKAAKGEDGKPNGRLFLPETKSLQDAFQNAVGVAFAGRPQAAQTAFQAMQAYYVGKAAQAGRLASNSSDVDQNFVQEAVRSVLGEVIDYNGRGEVLAPWGMDRSQFDTRVRQAFSSVKGQINWPANYEPALDSLGLQAAGADTYYLKQGRGFVVDKKGNPVTLNLSGPGTIDVTPDPAAALPPRKGRGVDQ